MPQSILDDRLSTPLRLSYLIYGDVHCALTHCDMIYVCLRTRQGDKLQKKRNHEDRARHVGSHFYPKQDP